MLRARTGWYHSPASSYSNSTNLIVEYIYVKESLNLWIKQKKSLKGFLKVAQTPHRPMGIKQ